MQPANCGSEDTTGLTINWAASADDNRSAGLAPALVCHLLPSTFLLACIFLWDFYLLPVCLLLSLYLLFVTCSQAIDQGAVLNRVRFT